MDMTIKDVAELFSITESAALELVKDKGLPGYRMGSNWMFSKSEVHQWALERGIGVSATVLVSGPAKAPVLLHQLISKGGIHYNLEAATSLEAIKNAAASIPELPGVSVNEITASLIEREHMMPTAIGSGIAVPHPRNPLITDIENECVSVFFLKKPVSFGALDGKPVHTLFIVLSSKSARHLEILAKLSFLCRQEQFIKFLENRCEMDDIIWYVKKEESQWDSR